MQNISYVFSVMGRDWVKGLKPAKNVGTNVVVEIERIINRLENQNLPSIASFHTNVSNLRKKKKRSAPMGTKRPRTTETNSTQYVRDANIVAWILDLAHGVCECCGKVSPFIREDGTEYLEVHHLKRLADGGSDTLSNAVAVCPNCHRELHYGVNKAKKRLELYGIVKRLVPE